MKRLMLLSLFLLISLFCVNCAAVPSETEPSKPAQTESTQINTESSEPTEEVPAFPPVLPAGFSAGYARTDITPESYPVVIASNMTGKKAADPLFATCVAISDGENIALLVSLDLKGVSGKFLESSMAAIVEATRVPKEYIFLNATHNHNAPLINSGKYNNAKWQKRCVEQITIACQEAILDLSPAEAYTGTADTKGFAFVRRYLCEDGSLQGIHHSIITGSPVKQHETEADSTLQAIRFTRGNDKKDIVMINWQAHAAHAANSYKDIVTADFIKQFRNGVEEQYDIHFAYYNGASGNINFSTKFKELKLYSSYVEVGKALVGKLGEALKNMEKVETGEVKAVTGSVTGVVRKDDPQRVVNAQKCNPLTGSEKDRLMKLYGFQSKYEVSSICSRAAKPEDQTIPLSAISCGDLAFAAASYEMFDTSGMEVKDNSPFKMTFICAYTNGQHGYMPSAFAFPHGGYEVDVSWFVEGTAELCVSELLSLLNAIHK